MALELNGTTGVSLVQDGVITDANLPAGSVLQVVSQNLSNTVDISSATFTDVFSLSITPSSASNKILLIASLSLRQIDPSDAVGVVALSRGGTQFNGQQIDIETASISHAATALLRLDSPSTTSSVSYRVDTRLVSGTFRFFGENDSSRTCSLVAMEIAG